MKLTRYTLIFRKGLFGIQKDFNNFESALSNMHFICSYECVRVQLDGVSNTEFFIKITISAATLFEIFFGFAPKFNTFSSMLIEVTFNHKEMCHHFI